jgi:hypothetical protein
VELTFAPTLEGEVERGEAHGEEMRGELFKGTPSIKLCVLLLPRGPFI